MASEIDQVCVGVLLWKFFGPIQRVSYDVRQVFKYYIFTYPNSFLTVVLKQLHV